MTLRKNALSAVAFAALVASAATTPALATTCYDSHPYRAITGRTVLVSSTTARPDDGVDDTAALQAALDSLQPGDALVFDVPGVYQHNATLYVRRPNVIVDGNGAELRGTNVDDQAVMVQSDDVEIRSFIINNVTDTRRTAPKHAAISLNSANEAATQIHRISVLANIIRGDGTNYDPGTPTQASSSGGIFVRNVDGFVIEGNRISRSVADGIHITVGSRNGRVRANMVENGGDDGIAVVSYLPGDWHDKLKTDSNYVVNTQAKDQVTNVLVYSNTVRGNYWGRGITVVGGRNVTIDGNYVTDITRAGGIYLSHEYGYNTYGDSNILVQNNVVESIGNTAPTFTPKGPGYAYVATALAQPNNIGHGGIEINGAVDKDEWLLTGVPAALSIRDILVQNNTVSSTRWPGIRLGATSSHFGAIGLLGNFVNNPWDYQIITQTSQPTGPVYTFDTPLYCANNRSNGNPWPYVNCSPYQAPPVVTGFTCNPGQI